MSRADSYGAYHRDAHGRLLHQVYAYCGNTEVARRSVDDAFVAAAHHWRKLEANPDKDAWMRERAWRATGRAQNRAREPWYVTAQSTDDAHRPLLSALAELPPAERQLVILCHLVGLDVAGASRERGEPASAARAGLDAACSRLADRGVDTSPAALASALEALRSDLLNEPVESAARLRREGNRRRRSHLLLAGVVAVGLVVGAGAVTAAQSPTEAAAGDASSDVPPAQPSAPAADDFAADDLQAMPAVAALDKSKKWRVALTSSDFGADQPISACLPGGPAENRAAHYWVRQFTAGSRKDPVQVSQSLLVATSPKQAKAAYAKTVDAVAQCNGASREIADYSVLSGIGDEASSFTLRYAMGDAVREEHIVLARTGRVVTAWVARPNPQTSIKPAAVRSLAADSVADVCLDAGGACTETPITAESRTPPQSGGSPGYLSTVDLPVFGGLSKGWIATTPKRVRANPAQTECDEADFAGGGATTTTARTYVVPDTKAVPTIFGMTETLGEFRTPAAARAFVNQTARRVARCEDRQPNASVQEEQEVSSGPVRGVTWQITLAPSENASLLFRVGLVRVGDTVAQVTFTPASEFDLTPGQYTALVERAGKRLQQL